LNTKYFTKNATDSTTQLVQLASNEIKPKVTIKMTIFNDKGIIPDANCKGEATTTELITLNENFSTDLSIAILPHRMNRYINWLIKLSMS